MALRISAGDDARRVDSFMVDPYQLLVAEEERGRHFAPSEDDILDMAASLCDRGQIQAVEARRVQGNALKLTLGFTRTAAARLIREGFTGTDGKRRHDPAFLLKVNVVDGNDLHAFERNIVENQHRNATSPIDDAFNQERLRDRYGKTDAEIATLYGYRGTAKVTRLAKLLRLPPDQQRMVHDGQLGVDAAINLLDIPEASQAQVIEQAKAKGGKKVSGAAIKAQVREHVLRDSEETQAAKLTDAAGQAITPPSPTRTIARTAAEAKAFLSGLEHRHRNEGVKRFASLMHDWLAGIVSDEAVEKAIVKAVVGE
jgi:ParB-like chromosome segregation protein Spo0J